METIYVDTATQTVVGYQCTSMRDAVNTANMNLGYPFYITNLINLFSGVLDSLHYTVIAVGTKNPWTPNPGLASFINNFPDF